MIDGNRDERDYLERLAARVLDEMSEVEKQLALIRVIATAPPTIIGISDLRQIKHAAGTSKTLSHLEVALVIQKCDLAAQSILTQLEKQ